jgi:hypothetical protein
MNKMPWETLRVRQRVQAEREEQRDAKARLEMCFARVRISKERYRIIQHGGFAYWYQGGKPVATFHFVSGSLTGLEAVELLTKLIAGEIQPAQLPGYPE